MTPQERAEKILSVLGSHTCFNLPKHTPELIDSFRKMIAAQISEAEREAHKRAGVDLANLCKEAIEEGKEIGFNAAREKAKGILDKQTSYCADHCESGEACDCIDKAADRISQMSPTDDTTAGSMEPEK